MSIWIILALIVGSFVVGGIAVLILIEMALRSGIGRGLGW